MVKSGSIGLVLVVVLAVVNSTPVREARFSQPHLPSHKQLEELLDNPAVKEIIGKIKHALESAKVDKRGLLGLGQNLVGGAARLGGNVLNTGLGVGAGLAETLANLAKNLVDSGANFAQNLAGTGAGFLRNAAKGAKDLAENAVGTANSVLTKRDLEINEVKRGLHAALLLRHALHGLGDTVGDLEGTLGHALKDLVGGAKEAAENVVDTAANVAETAADTAVNVVETAAETAGDVAQIAAGAHLFISF